MQPDTDLENIKALYESYPTISQTGFKKYVKALTTLDGDEALRQEWLSICIDPRLSVYVVDDVTGERLHRVPPLTYTTVDVTNNDFNRLVSEWIMHSEISPYHGNIYATNNIPLDMAIGTPPAEDVELWIKIMRDYGIVNAPDPTKETIAVEDIQDDPNGW